MYLSVFDSKPMFVYLTSSMKTNFPSLSLDRRRSNVVKEVEKLKENREKRRAQQAQILEEQETLRNKVSCDWLIDSHLLCILISDWSRTRPTPTGSSAR